jgi:hypothetical protein
MHRVFALSLLALALAFPAGAATTIVINSSADATTDQKHTCTYTQGGLFFPPGDGLCTFRRAIVEASARPQSDRPIQIVFDGILPLSGDPNYDPTTGVVTFPITAALPPLKTDTIININGSVTINGPARTPDGRPSVMIDSNWSLEVESENNHIADIGFHGGGGFSIKEDHNTLDGIMLGLREDGLEIELEDAGDPADLAGSGIHISGSHNTVSNSVIAGAYGKAIDINSGTTDNTIENNRIGTRFDGSVPVVSPAIECARSLTFDPNNWYGGWGIAIGGTGHTVDDNLIAGLHITQSANDTPPRALEIFGSNHVISNNVIGRDALGNPVGVCGQGIKVAGYGTEITGNVIVRSRVDSEGAVETAIMANDSSPTFGEITVQGNVVIDGPGRIFEYGPAVSNTLKLYKPAEITDVTGLVVTGSAAAGSPCDGCRIDVYLDDNDGDEEALEHLGFTIAGPTGDFTFDLLEPLPTGHGLRTMSTSNHSGAISGYGAGTSTEASADVFVPESPAEIFDDGFETGTSTNWSASQGG